MLTGSADAFTRYVSNFSGQQARRIRVGKSVTASFRQISDAIRSSRPYDRIEVESGRYFEALTISHSVELCSANDGEPPVIVSRGPCVKIITDDPVLVEKLCIVAKGTKASDSQGILIERGSPLIRDCEISSVHVVHDATPRILHCHICNSDYGCGLSITDSSGGVYVSNDISYHNEQCVYINTQGNPELRQNGISLKQGQKNVAVLISARLCSGCEPVFCENIIRGGDDKANQEGVDPASVHFPQMLYEDNSGGRASLVSVMNGATPFMTGNLLCNGVTGFYFKDCKLPKECFCNNRVIGCSAWGLVVGEGASLVAAKNEFQMCGGGICVSSRAACHVTAEKSYSIALQQCELYKNVHYGILVDRVAIGISGCSIEESSVGITLLGNCAASTITKNTLTGNRVAAFSVLRRGTVVIEDNVVHGCKTGMYGVFVQEGSNVTLRSTLIDGTLTSVFLRKGSCIVAEKNALRESSVHHVVLTGRSKATLRNNTIEGSSCASVVVASHSECTVLENVMYSGPVEGVLVEDGGSAIVENNSLSSFGETMYVKRGGSLQARGNAITLGQYGVVVEGKGSNAVVSNNCFREMSATAVSATEYSTVTVNGNTMMDFGALSIQIGSGATAVIEKNNFKNVNAGAIHVDGIGTHCKVLCCYMERVVYGVQFTRGSTGVIDENEIRLCNAFGVGCNSNGAVTVQGNTIVAAKTGIELVSAGDIRDNVIEESEVGIYAHTGATAQVRDHRLINCTVGLCIMNDVRANFTAIKILKSKQFGVAVKGPTAAATVSHVTIEDSGVAGVLVQNGGECRFEQCIVKGSKVDGIRMEQAGAVVFEQCSILEQCWGVKAVGALPNIGATCEPRFINCTIDGSLCQVGVSSSRQSIVHLELCKISARAPEQGRGVVVKEGGAVLLSRCDVFGCPCVGVTSSAMSHLMVEHSTIDGCGTGVCFSSEKDMPSSRQSRTTFNEGVNTQNTTRNTLTMKDGVTPALPTLSQVTIKRCAEAGILFEAYGPGAINCTSVVECGKGIVLQHGSTVTIDSTVVRSSVGCGVLLLGRPSSNSVLTCLTITDSGDCGIKVDSAVDADEAEAKEGREQEEPKKLPTFQNFEVRQNAKGGAVLEACVHFEGCTFAHNVAVGVLCSGNSRPLLSACHFTHNTETNLEAHAGSMPELQDCVVEHAPVGVRARSAVKMTRCIAQHLSIAVDVFVTGTPSDISQLLGCVFANNETGVSCAGEVCDKMRSEIFLEECVFHNSTGAGVHVYKGPKTLLKACSFETSHEGVHVAEEAVVVVEECGFKENAGAITSLDAASVEVRASTFAAQRQYAVSVTGDGGNVHIAGNHFSGNATHSVLLSAQETVVLVHSNTFEVDTCGIFLQMTPQVFVYNNCFRACQTGIVFHGAEFCGNVFGNIFEKNRCGCCCEENATAYLWRNTFKESSEYGMFVTTGATPIVVDSSFLHHTDSGSVALCVRDGGLGHFAFNRYSDNVCGVQLEGTGGAATINSSTFKGNDVAIQIKEGTAVHVMACTFASSVSSDIFASGAIERDQCVLAYNSFASTRSVGVTIENCAEVTVYRCIFFGVEGTGVVQGRSGKGRVLECLFYGLDCGVRVADRGDGTVGNSHFIRCATAVEVCRFGRGDFNLCSFVACPTGSAVLVSVHHASTPKFHQCSFIGWSKMLQPLLRSNGGGLVENSLFLAGELAVLLEGGCEMKLQKNTFLRGVLGVRFNPRSLGKVVKNTFHRHQLAAVNIMDNAAGELKGNVFAQPPEGGGLLVGLHEVVLDTNKFIDKLPARETKGTSDSVSMESNLIAAFAEHLAAAPQWVRHGMGETPARLCTARRPS
ncbi:hypothetical protein TRSC58_00753 [Trypanosoma rangeli SC58]|uniref:Right handed beta helix domain-containing protein n=1 Tax=Trypanosoma rangeli SC58 TaxID=429131 RepID=A0A061JAW6_TRYRA|nr:hypothetical protein TRSC58_00753 [Trypanosoma rangeli SC58]